MVIKGSDKVKTQGKAASAVAVTFFENTEHLEFADDVFSQNAFTSQLSIVVFLLGCE